MPLYNPESSPAALLSTDADNAATTGGDGGIYVPAGGSTPGAVSTTVAEMQTLADGSAAATGDFTFDLNPSDGEPMPAINGFTGIVFKDAPGAFPEIQIGIDLPTTLTSLASDLETNKGGVGNELLADLTFTADATHLLIVQTTFGVAGNSTTLGASTANIIRSGAVLTGGVDGFVPGQSYLITDAASSAAQLLIRAFSANKLEACGFGLFQNSAMSAPVYCQIWYDNDSDVVTGIYEPTNNNSVRGSDVLSAISAFPFDNALWHGNMLNNVDLLGLATGAQMRGVTADEGAQIDFNSKTGCLLFNSHFGASTTIMFLKDDGTAIEVELGPTAGVCVGDSVEAIVLQGGASLGTDALAFTDATELLIGSNSTVTPTVDNSFSVRQSTFGNFVHFTAAGDVAGASILDNQTLSTGAISNAIVLGDGALVGTSLQLPHVIKKAASANIRNSHDAEATHTGDSAYTLVKTITLSSGLVGAARFLFDLKTSNGLNTANGQIYRNGVALGTEQSDVTGGYVTKSEDITQDWNPGDTVELWVKIDDAGQMVSVQNFRIAYDDAPTVAVASANS